MSEEKVFMKGYKAFKKGLICDPTGKNPCQYEENSIKEFDDAKICALCDMNIMFVNKFLVSATFRTFSWVIG